MRAVVEASRGHGSAPLGDYEAVNLVDARPSWTTSSRTRLACFSCVSSGKKKQKKKLLMRLKVCHQEKFNAAADLGSTTLQLPSAMKSSTQIDQSIQCNLLDHRLSAAPALDHSSTDQLCKTQGLPCSCHGESTEALLQTVTGDLAHFTLITELCSNGTSISSSSPLSNYIPKVTSGSYLSSNPILVPSSTVLPLTNGAHLRDLHSSVPSWDQLLSTPSQLQNLVQIPVQVSATRDLPVGPVFGIATPHEEDLRTIMSLQLNSWGMDIFRVAELSLNQPLTVVTYQIFQSRRLLQIFNMEERRLVNYLQAVERHYNAEVPYHNATHAADVTQSSHVLLMAPVLEDSFSDLEILSVILSSAVHDVHHPGVTNQYLINTGHELALIYNDTSVLENHHMAVAFKLLQEENCNLLMNFSSKQRLTIRKLMIDLVLATDLSKHMGLLASLKSLVERRKSAVSSESTMNGESDADRLLLLQNILHCADLSNPTKPLVLYRQWTERVMEEFFRQGEMERQRNVEITPMCDRRSVSIPQAQVSFIQFIVHPLWETWGDLVHPGAQHILDQLESNQDWFQAQIP